MLLCVGVCMRMCACMCTWALAKAAIFLQFQFKLFALQKGKTYKICFLLEIDMAS